MTREEILAHMGALTNLPSFPCVVSEVQTELESPDASPRKVALIMEKDTALAARVVGLASGSAYGRVPPNSLVQAVTRIGFHHLGEVVLTAALMENYACLRGTDQRRFWGHGVAVGLTAKVLAGRAVQPMGATAGEVYLAGLLHDLGAIILCHELPEVARQVRREVRSSGLPAHVVEAEMFGVTHAEVGGVVSASLGLPAPCMAAVAYHHEPWRAAPEVRPVAQIVQIADFICCNQDFGRPGAGFHTHFDPDAWALTGLDIDDVPGIIERVQAIAKETERYLPAAA